MCRRAGRCVSIPWWPCATSRRLRMSFLRNITKGLRSLFRKQQVDRELDEELRAYQEMGAEEKMKDGLSRKKPFAQSAWSVEASKSVRKSFALAAGNPLWRYVGKICALASACCGSLPASPSSPPSRSHLV